MQLQLPLRLDFYTMVPIGQHKLGGNKVRSPPIPIRKDNPTIKEDLDAFVGDRLNSIASFGALDSDPAEAVHLQSNLLSWCPSIRW